MPKPTTLHIHTDINTGENLALADYPTLSMTEKSCQKTIAATLTAVQDSHPNLLDKSVSASLYLVAEKEGKQLNQDYRGKDYATNVLSFPSDLPSELLTEMNEYPLGELVICLPVVQREAVEQGKTVQQHFTHLLVHGCLHLLGYDHELTNGVSPAEAQQMENIEITVLNTLGIASPY